MGFSLDSEEAIGAVDAIFAGVGLEHGTRRTRTGAWKDGERKKAARASKEQQPSPRGGVPGIVSIPEWSRFGWLQAGFSTRQGGGTDAYGHDGEQNLGWTEQDAPETVRRNRQAFIESLSAAPSPLPLVTLRQMHSGLIRIVEGTAEAIAAQNVTADGKAVLQGDALVTTTPGVLLGIVTADCVPVLLADTRTHAVAALHAGWRGTLRRIVERAVGSMVLQFGSRAEDIVAAIGPSIGSCCFAVGEEVRFDFESQFAYAPLLFSEVYDSDPVRDKYPLLFLTARAPGHSNIGPQIHLDLPEANRRQLLDAGVPEANISIVRECTACTRLPDGRRKYFSHRAEHGYTGRMLSVIGAQV